MAKQNILNDNTSWGVESTKIESNFAELYNNKVDKIAVVQTTGASLSDVMSQKSVTDEITQLAGDVNKKSKYPYEDGFVFNPAFVLNAGIDKWLIDAHFDWEYEEGFRYSFAVISKTNLTARLYKHVDGQPASGHVLESDGGA